MLSTLALSRGIHENRRNLLPRTMEDAAQLYFDEETEMDPHTDEMEGYDVKT